MAVKNMKLNAGLKKINIITINSDIYVHAGEVPEPLLKYSGEIDVKQNREEAIIKESFKSENSNKNFFGFNKIKIGNSTVVQSGSNNITISGNCITVTNSSGSVFTSMSEENNAIELIVPKQMDTLVPSYMSFDLEATSGNIRIEDMILNTLMAESINGKITLKDIDAVVAKLKTMNGSIKAEIVESIMNYITKLETLNGKRDQETLETELPVLLSEKHNLTASSLNGSVKVLFKGKKSI